MIDVKITGVPFCTIEPNVGVTHVIVDCVCKKHNLKCSPKNGFCKDGKRFIPVKLIDVAGLVPGAHEGRGLGNQFLDDLRQASCLIHTVDCSGRTDAEGKATSGYYPGNDVRFLAKEIDLWFKGIVERALSKFERKSGYSKVDLLDVLTGQLTGLQVTKAQISQVLDKVGLGDTERFASELRKLSKPIIVAANKIDLLESGENLKKMKEEFSDLTIIPTSAATEIALKTANEKGLIDYSNNKFTVKDPSKIDGKQMSGLKFIEENILKKYGSTGIQECLNKAVFDVLDYIVVYPVADINKLTDKTGNVLPDAFLIKRGTTLKEFAYIIHTDIGEKFIGGLEAKTKKKLGADYALQNDDVVEILFKR
jgi:ribosome-binding ATPase YchF (GTP1/OBG family)